MVIVTQSDIENGLRILGLSSGDLVEVHSSLSAFGRVEGGAASVVDALLAVVGPEGAVMMSAYPVSKPLPLTDAERALGIHAVVRLYGPEYDGPTGMGAIADEFRRRPGVVLGPGFHRVAVRGCDAVILSEGYHRLLERDGLVLLLGVGLGSCSCMHQAEKAGIPEEIQAYFRTPDEIRRAYPENTYVDWGGTPGNAWNNVWKEAERRGLIAHQRIGAADCKLFRARPVVSIYEHALRSDPYSLFGLAAK